MNDTLIPQNLDAEEATIGSIMIAPEGLREVRAFLKPEDFYFHKLRYIYEAIIAIVDRGDAVDFVTVGTELDNRGLLETVGGQSYLASLLSKSPSSIHVESYARIVENQSIRRDWIAVANKLATSAYDNKQAVEDMLTSLENLVKGLRRGGKATSLRPAVLASVDLLSRVNSDAPAALATGIRPLDAAIGGFPIAETTLIAGDTSTGKTALTLQIAENIARNRFDPQGNLVAPGNRVLYVTTESKAYTMVARRVCGQAGIDQRQLRTGNLTDAEKDLLADKVRTYQYLFDKTLIFDDESLSLDAIERSIIECKPDLVVIDHLGELKHSERSTTEGLLNNCTRLKELGKKYNAAMLIIHITSADDGVTDEDSVPSLKTLGWARDLRYKVDILLGLYSSQIKTVDPNVMNRYMWLLKDREGPRFSKIMLKFLGKEQRFIS